MNFEIIPFTYITRSTGLYAVLRNEKIAAIPNDDGDRYALWKSSPLNASNYRLPIDIPQTLRQFTEEKFDKDEVFRSATEICDLWMVPQGRTLGNTPAFWENHLLTGENLRERIYTTVYPRLTTKSNVFTVHIKAQSLKTPPGLPAGQWDEARGSITGEYQGSALIERHIDPNNQQIPDYATNPAATPPLQKFFRWRTLNQVRFVP